MKRIIALILLMLLLLAGCGAPAEDEFAPNDSVLITADPETENNESTEPENTTPENTTPENVTPENNEPENTTPENATPENTTPESTTPENTTPENTPQEQESEEEVETAEWTTSCMTFNVLQIKNPGTGFADPDVRAPWILDTIVRYDPDLLGLQELTGAVRADLNGWDMKKYLIDTLTKKGYQVSGMMDSKGKAGSKVALDDYNIASGLFILWKKDRFELKDYGAMVYSNDTNRHYQWVKLYDKQEDITILMTNTHMSVFTGDQNNAYGDSVRAQQGNELYTFWDKNCGDDMALYATGDYNHVITAQAFANMTKGRFVSSRDVSTKAYGDSGVDHILINGDIQDCSLYQRIDDTYQNGTGKTYDKREEAYCPSDHQAVIVYCSNAYR